MNMNNEEKMNSLRETIALSIEAHELMVIELGKAHKKTERLRRERDSLKKTVEELKEGQRNEKTDDNRRQ